MPSLHRLAIGSGKFLLRAQRLAPNDGVMARRATPTSDVLSKRTREDLRRVAALRVPSVVSMDSASESLATTALEELAQLVGDIPEPDVQVLAPKGARWTVDELRASVLGTLRTYPQQCWLLAICDADAMSAQAQSLLLKTLEEPLSPALVFLCTSHPERLLLTLAGRISASLHVSVDPEILTEAARTLEGASTPAVAACTRLLEDPKVLKALTKDPTLMPKMVQAMDRPFLAGASTTAAVEIRAEMESLAKSLYGATRAKPESRRLVECLLDCWEARAGDGARRASTPAAWGTATRHLRAIANARFASRTNAPLLTVLTQVTAQS